MSNQNQPKEWWQILKNNLVRKRKLYEAMLDQETGLFGVGQCSSNLGIARKSSEVAYNLTDPEILDILKEYDREIAQCDEFLK